MNSQQKPQKDMQKNLELLKKLQETKKAVEKEIHKRLVLQLSLRAVNKAMTEEDQNLLEQLYLDLRSINPELAFATIKAAASLSDSYKNSKENQRSEDLKYQKKTNHQNDLQQRHVNPSENARNDQKRINNQHNVPNKSMGMTRQSNLQQRAASFHNHNHYQHQHQPQQF